MQATPPPPPPKLPESADGAALSRALKALGDEKRLWIVALLARRPHYGEELSEVLGLSPATVSHHLRTLREAQLVLAERQPPYVLYHCNRLVLDAIARTLREVSELALRLGLPSETQISDHILRAVLDAEGKIPELPRGRRQRAVVLRWVAHHFESGRIYPEREIHRVLLQLHHDMPGLREALLQEGWLQRSGAVYRRLEEVESP